MEQSKNYAFTFSFEYFLITLLQIVSYAVIVKLFE